MDSKTGKFYKIFTPWDIYINQLKIRLIRSGTM